MQQFFIWQLFKYHQHNELDPLVQKLHKCKTPLKQKSDCQGLPEFKYDLITEQIQSHSSPTVNSKLIWVALFVALKGRGTKPLKLYPNTRPMGALWESSLTGVLHIFFTLCPLLRWLSNTPENPTKHKPNALDIKYF